MAPTSADPDAWHAYLAKGNATQARRPMHALPDPADGRFRLAEACRLQGSSGSLWFAPRPKNK